MPKASTSENEVKRLYDEIRNETDSFQDIRPELLVRNPQKILIFRLALRMSQNEFERFLGSENKNITKYELRKIRNMQLRTARKITDRILEKIRPVTFKEVLRQFRKSVNESKGWFKANENSVTAFKARRKGAIESLKFRRTPQEKILEESLKLKKIKFFVNYPLKENLIVDFYLPENRLVIECKDIMSTSRRENKEQIQRLAYQGYKVKFYFPDKKVFALIKSPLKLERMIKEELQGPFDNVFCDFKKLTNVL